MKQGLCRALSCVDVSETVALALPCQSCADVSEKVAMAFRAKAVRTYRRRQLWLCHVKAVWTCWDGSYGCAVPKLFGRIETVAKALRCQSSALSSEQARRPRLNAAQIVKR